MKLKITSEEKKLKRKFLEIHPEEDDPWTIFETACDELSDNCHKYIDLDYDITSVTVTVKRRNYTCEIELYHEDCCQCGGYTDATILRYYKDGEEIEFENI